ncbi:single-stranded DNA-binding protein [Oligella ureolytica]
MRVRSGISRVLHWRQAEVAGQYLKKGSQIYVEGRLRTNKYTDKDGIVRYTTDVMGEKLMFGWS